MKFFEILRASYRVVREESTIARLIKYLLPVLLLTFGAAVYAYANIVRCVLIDFGGFREAADNVYVSQALPRPTQGEVDALIRDARLRVEKQYGAPRAKPVIIVVGTDEEARDYGLHDSPGKLFFVPWQNYRILSYEKGSIDVAAHELVHAEIVERLGYALRQETIPTWFDEGAALQVDFRPQYAVDPDSFDDAEVARVMTLDSPGEFWSSDKAQNSENYQAAKVAVALFFRQHQAETLYSLLERIKDGKESQIGLYKPN